MEFNKKKTIDTSSFLRNRSKAYMSMSPKASFDNDNNKNNRRIPIHSSYKSNMCTYSSQYQLPSYVNNSTKIIKSSHTGLLSPNRFDTPNTSISYKLHGENTSNISTECGLMSTENNHVLTSNQILNRSNCDLKAQIKTLQQQLDSYKATKSTLNELKQYTDYLNTELSRANQQNRELASLYESISLHSKEITNENTKLKEEIVELNQQYQHSLKTNDELKWNYHETKEKLEVFTDEATLTLREKDKMISQLTNCINDVKEKNKNLNKTITDYDELNMTMKKSIGILSQKNTGSNVKSLKDSLQEKDKLINDAKEKMNSAIEENRRIIKECNEKDIIIGVKQGEIEERDKLYVEIEKMKEDQEVFITKINSLNEVIANRDHTIEELKSSFNTLNDALIKITEGDDTQRYHLYRNPNSVGDNKYKELYEQEVKQNEKLKQQMEELHNITKEGIDSRQQSKINYEEENNTMQKNIQQILGQYSNIEEVFKENNTLRKQNDHLKRITEMSNVSNNSTTLQKENEAVRNEQLPMQLPNKTLQEESNKEINYTSYSIYNICKKKLIAYDFTEKIFRVVNPQYYDLFLTYYQEEGSITYNTLKGLFVLTGSNYNMVFYYSQIKNSISQIIQLDNNHCNGSIVMDDVTQNLIFLSGSNNAIVEQFEFKKNQLTLLPSMLQARANASYCFINHCLYGFFGYNYQSKQITNTIEYLDFDNSKSWEHFIYSSKDNFNYACAYHLVMNMEENEVLLLGGIKGSEEALNQKIIAIDISNKTIGETETNLPSIQENKVYLFESNSQYNILPNGNDNFCMVAMDNMNNVHIIDSELKYEVIVFAQNQKN